MKVRVKMFAAAKELIGRSELELDVDVSATIADVRRAVEAAHPELRPIVGGALWAVDADYASEDRAVTEHSDIALIPPVSGG
jgi:molybdopterin converting factor small subunit